MTSRRPGARSPGRAGCGASRRGGGGAGRRLLLLRWRQLGPAWSPPGAGRSRPPGRRRQRRRRRRGRPPRSGCGMEGGRACVCLRMRGGAGTTRPLLRLVSLCVCVGLTSPSQQSGKGRPWPAAWWRSTVCQEREKGVRDPPPPPSRGRARARAARVLLFLRSPYLQHQRQPAQQ